MTTTNNNNSSAPPPGYSVRDLFRTLDIQIPEGTNLRSRGPDSLAAPPASGATAAIVTGQRNATLASMAGSMRARNMAEDAIAAALLTTNAQQCNPPLPDDEVRAIARSIANYPAGTPYEVLRTLNDAGNADRFANQWGDNVSYVPELKNYLLWNGCYWQPDTVGAVMEMAKKTAFAIYAEGAPLTDNDLRDAIARHSKTSQQAPRLNAMLELAKSIPTLVVPIAMLDADPWLLGLANGTLDLRNGAFIPALREQYITKVAPVDFDPTAECPLFLKFLCDIMAGDRSLIEYLQRVLGYMLTGETTEHCLFYLFDTGANGKSTLLNLCRELMGGDLCRQTPVETIMARGAR